MTLRRTLVLSIVALFVTVTIATGLTSMLVTRQSLIAQLDEQVKQSISRAVGDDRRRQGGPQGDDGPGRGIGGDFLLLDVRGSTVVRFTAYTKDGARVDDSGATIANQLMAAPLGTTPQTVDLGGDLGTYRLVRRDVAASTTISGLPLRHTDDALRGIALTTAGVGLLGLVLLAAGAAWLIRWNLRPLERVAALAGRVSRTPLARGEVRLPERVDPADTDERTEVGQVGAALNDLLDHVDASLSARHASEMQLRRFVADASHELRTPLASIRGYAELSRREPEPVPDRKSVV